MSKNPKKASSHYSIAARYTRLFLFSFCTVLFAVLQPGQAALPPSAFKAAQEAAGEHLELQILSARVTDDGEFTTFVSAEARVLKVHRSRTNLNSGQVIDINYEDHNPYRGRPGPQGVPILREGTIVEAFLEAGIGINQYTYSPAASGGSFSILRLADITNSLGMKMIPLPNRYRTDRIYLAATEVTKDQYASLIPSASTESSDSPSGNLPQVDISWHEAVEFCKKLTEKESAAGNLPDGLEYRLPTRNEWMEAYNSDRDFHETPLKERAWFIKDNHSEEVAKPVAKLKPNRFGWYDLDGNVMEWCLDDPDLSDGTDWAIRNDKVTIGGSFGNLAEHWIHGPPAYTYPRDKGQDFIGFRVVLAPVKLAPSNNSRSGGEK